MGQPTPYTRTTNFTDYSTSRPSDPQQGTSLDTEFNDIKTTTDQIRSNLAQLQRDDGLLVNKSVHAEALSTAVLTLIKASANGYNVKGSWAASTAYAVGDLVEFSQATYLCFEAHQSGDTFGANSAKFILLANAAIQTTSSAVDQINGDGSTQTFTLTNNAPSGVTDVLVFVNGELRTPTTQYTVTSNSITFTTAPSSGTNNIIVWGTSTVVEAAKQAAIAARDTAETHRDDASEHKTTASRWASKVDGTVVDADTAVDSNEYSSKSYATSESTPTTIYVTVAGGKFVLNGKTISSGSDSIYNVIKGTTYTFDVSDSTNGGHPLNFSISAEDATPDYTVTRNGTPGQAGATVTFAVPSDAAATIYFYCGNHSGMGATLTSITESYAPSAGSAKEWASKTDGDIGSEYSSKMYAQETSGDHSHGGSSKGWAQTAKNTQVPGASSTDRSAKHYSEVAEEHKDAAALAQAAAETALDTFDDRFLGSKTVSTHPTQDNDGNSILTGALYWNTGSGSITQGMYVYNGSAWITLQTSVGGDTVTSTTGNNLNLVTPSNSNKVVINSGSVSIQLPNVRAAQDNYVLAMSNTSTGETVWQVTQTAPTITGITSGQLNSYYDADGTTVSNDKGGTLVIAGSDFGVSISDITAVRICASDGTSQVNATTVGSLSDTSITATWDGTESGYSSFSGVYHVEIVKSGLISNRFNSTKSFSADPTISSVTGTGGEGDGVTVTSSNLGSYGGTVAGGGQDSNTKLLLNFDRTGGTDIEDSSNVGGEGHKVTASGNAVIKSSPFGDGKSAMFFDGSNDILRVGSSADFGLGSGAFTIEGWAYKSSATNVSGIIFSTRSSSSGWSTEWQLRMHSNGYFTWFANGGGSGPEKAFSNFSYAVNTWYHFALVRDSNNTIELFIDGVSRGTHTDSTNYNVAKELQIGAQYTSSSDNWFNGYLDELRIVKGTAVYTGDFDVPTSRLTAITNTVLLIHSNQSGDGVFLGDPVQKSHSITMSPSNLIETYYNADNSYTQYQHLTKEHLINGVREDGLYVSEGGNDNTGDYVRFDCGSGKSVVANGIFWAQDRNAVHGSFQVQGSNDASSWTTLTSSDITIGTSSGSVYEYSYYFTNTNAYRYYQIIGTGGNWSQHSGPWIREIALLNNAFTDSATSGTTHTITPTGSYHSQAHGGIAPALAFPASLKKTGSAGVYFDGNGDVLNLNISDGDDFDTAFATGVWSLDSWCYMSSYPADNKGMDILSGTDNTAHGYDIGYHNTTQGSTGYWGFIGGTPFTQSTNCTDLPSLNTWFHILMVCNWSGSNMTLKIYKNGEYLGEQTSSGSNQDLSNFTDQIYACIGGNAYHNIGGGSGGSGDKSNWHGYLDNWRFSGNDVTADSSDPLYTNGQTSNSSINFVSGLPTKIYGAMFPANPSVGTITITGATTDSTDIAFTEINNSLPNGLTLNDQGAGNQTATITGTLTDSVTSDTTTNNIRIQAKANADDKRITEVNESSGVGAVSITKKAGGEPVLFNARRYVGSGVAPRDINGFGFKPDFIWIKERVDTDWHVLYDSVRGVASQLFSNNSNAQGTSATQVTSFNPDGYTFGNTGAGNADGQATIAWAWKAGTSFTPTASNYTNPVGSKNTAGGFSIVKVTAGSSAAGTSTVTHGLNQKPDFIIGKALSGTYNWDVFHKGLTGGYTSTKRLNLNTDTNEINYYSGGWGVTNTQFNTGGTAWHGANTDVIYYCFHAVSGVSAFGTYSGASNPVTVYTTSDGTSTGSGGFSPRFVIVKRIDGSGGWWMYDKFRGVTGSDPNQHTETKSIKANTSDVEASPNGWHIQFLTNAFKFPDYARTGVNNNGETYIYMAFA